MFKFWCHSKKTVENIGILLTLFREVWRSACAAASVPSGLMTGLSHTTYNRWQFAAQTRHSVTQSEILCSFVSPRQKKLLFPFGVRKVKWLLFNTFQESLIHTGWGWRCVMFYREIKYAQNLITYLERMSRLSAVQHQISDCLTAAALHTLDAGHA